MKILKIVITAIMVLIAGINGLLSSQGVATLCIHGINFLHLTTGSHDEEHNHCKEHSCEDSAQDDSETIAITATESCQDHCTDIELKGVDNEAPQRNGVYTHPNPPVEDLESFHYDFSNFPVTTHIYILPPPRGPPPFNVVTELCIKKTVLRL